MVMDRIYYDKKKRKWLDVPEKYTKEKLGWKKFEEETDNLSIALHQMLRKKLDNIKKIVKRKWDAVFIIDGNERGGKSTLGMTAAWYLSNGKLTLNNFAAGINDASEKIDKLPDGSILFVDEGSLVFNSKDSMTREAKKLQKILDVVGQKNMIFIIVLPCFFDLNKNIATRRSKFLLHVYTASDLQRGRFSYFSPNKKRHLYTLGKKNFGSYSKPKADWLGSFVDFHLPFDEEYIKLKRKSLAEALGNEDSKDGKIKLGDIRAMYVQSADKKFPGLLNSTKLARIFCTNTNTIARERERKISESLLSMCAAQRINVDFTPDQIS